MLQHPRGVSDTSDNSAPTGDNSAFTEPGDVQAANFEDNGFGNWEALGGRLTSGPDACSWAPGRLDVFALGEDSGLWHKSYEGGWSDWQSLGRPQWYTITSTPSAVSRAFGRIDVFARGQDNYGLWRMSYEGGWSEWTSLGERPTFISGRPEACWWGPGRLDVFARVPRNGNRELWHKSYEPAGGWESLGGELTSDPSAVSWALDESTCSRAGRTTGCGTCRSTTAAGATGSHSVVC